MGLAATLVTKEYEDILAGHPLYPDPYMVVAHTVLKGVSKVIREQRPDIKRAMYVFETGHRARTEADAMIDLFVATPRIKEEFRYAGHGFVPKVGNPVVQAADLLAWQWTKDRKNQIEGRKRRADLKSLLEHPHGIAHVTPEFLTKMNANRDETEKLFSEVLSLAKLAKSPA